MVYLFWSGPGLSSGVSVLVRSLIGQGLAVLVVYLFWSGPGLSSGVSVLVRSLKLTLQQDI